MIETQAQSAFPEKEIPAEKYFSLDVWESGVFLCSKWSGDHNWDKSVREVFVVHLKNWKLVSTSRTIHEVRWDQSRLVSRRESARILFDVVRSEILRSSWSGTYFECANIFRWHLVNWRGLWNVLTPDQCSEGGGSRRSFHERTIKIKYLRKINVVDTSGFFHKSSTRKLDKNDFNFRDVNKKHRYLTPRHFCNSTEWSCWVSIKNLSAPRKESKVTGTAMLTTKEIRSTRTVSCKWNWIPTFQGLSHQRSRLSTTL